MSNKDLMIINDQLGFAKSELQQDPEEVLAAAIKASKALQRVVAGKAKPVIINDEQYLEFEDWQTLGQFYGYTVRTSGAQPVEINGSHGAYAKAELIDLRTGEIMGGADAYCMGDEERWANKPWFQIASMAQTRAAAKALRNRLAWIAVLAGYRPTPAEEMTGAEGQQHREHWCTLHNVAFKKFTKNDRSWYSHKAPDGSWCNEPKASEPETVSNGHNSAQAEPSRAPIHPIGNSVSEQAPQPKAPTAKIWALWNDRKKEAEALGLAVPLATANITEAELIQLGKDLAEDIRVWHAQQATPAQPDSSPDGEDDFPPLNETLASYRANRATKQS